MDVLKSLKKILRERIFYAFIFFAIAFYFLWQLDLAASRVVEFIPEWDTWFGIIPTWIYYNICMFFVIAGFTLSMLAWLYPYIKKLLLNPNNSKQT